MHFHSKSECPVCVKWSSFLCISLTCQHSYLSKRWKLKGIQLNCLRGIRCLPSDVTCCKLEYMACLNCIGTISAFLFTLNFQIRIYPPEIIMTCSYWNTGIIFRPCFTWNRSWMVVDPWGSHAGSANRGETDLEPDVLRRYQVQHRLELIWEAACWAVEQDISWT
jgi:hypothetical protein